MFFGITIRMYYNEHDPPHFHAEYQGEHGKFDPSGRMLAGSIQSRSARRLIREWAKQHEAEIEANWQRMKAGRRLAMIAPLR